MASTFAPHLYIPHHVTDISFYIQAFNAVELRRFNNDDGSVHVAELSIDGNIFHLHQESAERGMLSPANNTNTTTVTIGLYVDDVDTWMARAIKAGAVLIEAAQSYDYGLRQGVVKDLFGHHWLLQARI